MPAAAPTAEERQAPVLAFLANPASYAINPETVERIETHGAYVFLAGTEVYKIKRAVQFSYMDFSTLEKRHAACAREIAINQPAAPQIYHGLVAITEEPEGRLAIGGTGRPVEWAVHMARFPESAVLAHHVASMPLEPELAKHLADAVFDFHAAARVESPHDSSAQMRAIITEIGTAMRATLPAADRPAVEAFVASAGREVEQLTPLLNRRGDEGRVRRCHGDLHLGNIVVLEGRPVLFDALEFDEAMATIDVLYDLAFLLMDLDHRGSRASANTILNRYLWRTAAAGELDGLAALPLFMALRAGIRAMVRAQRAQQAEPGSGSPQRTEARAYLARANALLEPAEPALILVGGLSGSGKSTLAASLAPRVGRAPGALHLRSDLERKALFKAGEFERLPPGTYSPEANERVYAILVEKAGRALRAGQSVIADAVHAKPGERAELEALASRTGAVIAKLWLEAPPQVLLSRVQSRVADASDATPEIVERQLDYALGSLDWTRIDASGTPGATLVKALQHLEAIVRPS